MTVYSQIQSNKRRSILLIVLFVGFIVLLGWLLSYWSESGPAALVLAAIVATVMSLVSYYAGDKIALFSSGAKGPITVEDNPYIYHIVENLAITAGIPMPKVYLINDQSPNAFATGRDPQHASIAFTTGIVQLLTNEELEGVAAHELSHIKNYDSRLMMIVIICVGMISLLANGFMRFSILGGRHDNRNSRDSNQVGLVLAIIGFVLLIFSPLVAKLIQLAVSRKREFLADASGALLTRYPEGLAKALEKIEAQSTPMIHANAAMSHLYFANPFGHKASLKNLFSTHPPTSERIQALRSIA